MTSIFKSSNHEGHVTLSKVYTKLSTNKKEI